MSPGPYVSAHRRWWRLASLALAGLVLVGAGAGATESLLELDSRGGYTRERRSDEPYLAVLADGRVMRSGPDDASPVELCRLDAIELESLVRFVRAEQGLDTIDPEELARRVEAAREAAGAGSAPRPRIADLPTTILRVRTEKGLVELAHEGLGRDARRFEHIAELQAMLAVSERLQSLCGQAQ